MSMRALNNKCNFSWLFLPAASSALKSAAKFLRGAKNFGDDLSDAEIPSSATPIVSFTILFPHYHTSAHVRGGLRWWLSLAHSHRYYEQADLLYGSKGASILCNKSSGEMHMEYGGLPRSLSGRNPMSTLVRDKHYGLRTIEADCNRHHWSRRPRQGMRTASSEFAKPVLMLVD